MSTDQAFARIAYVHGRPCSHPTQQMMARSIGADFFPVDFRLRWQDRADASTARKLASWATCALTFPRPQEYDLFLAAGTHVFPPLMRALGRLGPHQRLVVHFGDEMIYSLHAGWHRGAKRAFLLDVIARYDAAITEGDMQAELLREMLGERCPRIYPVINSGRTPEFERYSRLQPDLSSHTIVNVSGAANRHRLWYKGIDLLLAGFDRAFRREPRLRLVLVGVSRNELVDRELAKMAPAAAEAVTFTGYLKDLSHVLSSASLYVHPSRGDAFPTASVLAMNAGLPAIVSNVTGTRQIVRRAEPSYEVPLDAHAIGEAILGYYTLPLAERSALSERFRVESHAFNERASLELYQRTVDRLLEDLGVPKRVRRVDALALERAQPHLVIKS